MLEYDCLKTTVFETIKSESVDNTKNPGIINGIGINK